MWSLGEQATTRRGSGGTTAAAVTPALMSATGAATRPSRLRITRRPTRFTTDADQPLRDGDAYDTDGGGPAPEDRPRTIARARDESSSYAKGAGTSSGSNRGRPPPPVPGAGVFGDDYYLRRSATEVDRDDDLDDVPAYDRADEVLMASSASSSSSSASSSSSSSSLAAPSSWLKPPSSVASSSFSSSWSSSSSAAKDSGTTTVLPDAGKTTSGVRADGEAEDGGPRQTTQAAIPEQKTVRVTDGRLVIRMDLDRRTAYRKADGVLTALYPTFPKRTPISLLINDQLVPLREVYEKAQHQNPVPYLINFKVQQLVPPEPPQEGLPEGELTLCELNSDLLTIKGSEDTESLARYISAEGVRYPNIVIPLTQSTAEKEKKSVKLTKTTAPKEDFLSQLWRWSSVLKRKRDGVNFDYIDGSTTSRSQTSEPRPIVAFAWHQYKQIFAVARADNTINIYDLSAQQWSPICLKHEMQTNITSIEWQPLAGAVLAVGCRAGVLVWRVPLVAGRDTMASSEKYTATVALLQHSGHGPVTSISWSPDGQFLASASPYDSSVIVWDRMLGVGTPLARWGGPGIHLVKWSPNGYYLFAATTSSLFFVFETKTWSYQKWNFGKPCQAATWSGDGRYLLVAEAGESTMHAIRFRREPPLISSEYVRGESVGPYKVVYPKAGEKKVGGAIRALEWDRTGERLAVTFSGDEEGTELIAIYATRIHPFLQFTPRGFIRGPKEGKKATSIAFAHRFPRGALLAACWLSGKISFYPLYYQATSSVELRKW